MSSRDSSLFSADVWNESQWFIELLFVRPAGEVPGSAVLVFDIELVDMEEGLPEGYMFIWNDEVSPDLFSEMDKNTDKKVEPSEVCQVALIKIFS